MVDSAFDSAAANQDGTVTSFLPGLIRVGAVINGKTGFASVTVKPQAPARIEIDAPRSALVIGAAIALGARAVVASGDPYWRLIRLALRVAFGRHGRRSGVVTAVAPGTATIRASVGSLSATTNVRVIAGGVQRLTVQPATASLRTGDVVRYNASVLPAGLAQTAVRWSVSGDAASIDADGVFVAERPGTYVVTAAAGNRAASASVIVLPRNVQRTLEVVGRTPIEEFQTLEQWIVGNYAYVTSAYAGRLWVYDVSNPSAPVKVDSLAFDGRVLNDVSTTADGRIAVISREGASSRKNGIVFLDTSDQAHPKVVSEYTETVTGGVHSAFIDGHYVYITDGATGSLRVIDFRDVKTPKEVGRWAPDRKVQMFKRDKATSLSAG